MIPSRRFDRMKRPRVKWVKVLQSTDFILINTFPSIIYTRSVGKAQCEVPMEAPRAAGVGVQETNANHCNVFKKRSRQTIIPNPPKKVKPKRRRKNQSHGIKYIAELNVGLKKANTYTPAHSHMHENRKTAIVITIFIFIFISIERTNWCAAAAAEC